MHPNQCKFLTNKKKKPCILGNNEPRVNWKQIIWKCHKHFQYPSYAEYFAHCQELDLGVTELMELRKRQDSGQIGHKSPRKNLVNPAVFPQPDLDCDDPLYDGKPIF